MICDAIFYIIYIRMIFEQLFDTKSSTYTYIVSSGKGREALIIDPVIEHTDEYIKVLENLELKLVKVIDTHIHACLLYTSDAADE